MDEATPEHTEATEKISVATKLNDKVNDQSLFIDYLELQSASNMIDVRDVYGIDESQCTSVSLENDLTLAF
jgi:hypothetical protein